jgi:hypothetical protein
MCGADGSDSRERAAVGVPPRTGISALASPPGRIGYVSRRTVSALRQILYRRHPAHAPRGTEGGRVLVAGWFSWTGRGATAGDVQACEVVCEWLSAANRAYDIASALPSLPGIDWRQAHPALYSDVVFVCGPVGSRASPAALLRRFPSSRHVGINLTMLEPKAAWNPFDALIERDSDVAARPDLSFAAPSRELPVVGLVLVEPYAPEYGARDMQSAARAAVERLINAREAAIVEIDTRLEQNARGLRTADEVFALIRRVDAVVTTRLHGLVLAIKAGVPALAIDPVAGGAKIRRQAEAIGWPHFVVANELVDADLSAGLDACLTADARTLAWACASRAATAIDHTRARFVAMMTRPAPG